MKYFFTTKLFSLRSPSLSAGLKLITSFHPSNFTQSSPFGLSPYVLLHLIFQSWCFSWWRDAWNHRAGLQHPKDLAKAELIKIWAVGCSPFRNFYYVSHMYTWTSLRHTLFIWLQFKELLTALAYRHRATPTSNKWLSCILPPLYHNYSLCWELLSAIGRHCCRLCLIILLYH